jgi:hypothetical protein
VLGSIPSTTKEKQYKQTKTDKNSEVYYLVDTFNQNKTTNLTKTDMNTTCFVNVLTIFSYPKLEDMYSDKNNKMAIMKQTA